MDPDNLKSSDSPSSSYTSSSFSASHTLFKNNEVKAKVIQHAAYAPRIDTPSLQVPEPVRKISCPPLQTSSPELNARRRSVGNPLLMGQSCHIEQQHPCWLEFSLHGSSCFCDPCSYSWMRSHWVPEATTPSPWVYRAGGSGLLNSLAEGYQTLPTKMTIWHENRDGFTGSEYGTPPCPPIRTSSKRSSGFAYIDCGQSEFQCKRPVSSRDTAACSK